MKETRITRSSELTPMQAEIMRLIADGSTLKEAGDKVRKSPFTVNNEVVKVRRKLGAANNVHAVYMLTKQGVL